MRLLIVGAGGIGCPAAWCALSAGHDVRLVDPDVVEASNLPRQVLYTEAHVGQPKALAAAQVLRHMLGEDAGIEGVHGRADETTWPALLRSIDGVIDATDGALTKDWLNQAAVRAGVPMLHAAGLRSEARLLPVAASGAPCLSCVFGRLVEEGGSCADLGVWNGVVGTVGALAVARIEALVAGGSEGASYDVLDFDAGRGMALDVAADAACEVCGASGRAASVEVFPEAADCAVAGGEEAASPRPRSDAHLDLRTERCPVNLLRARQVLAQLPPGTRVDVRLGAEGAQTVPQGLEGAGHTLVWQAADGEGLRLVAERGTQVSEVTGALASEELERFARQLVLPAFGPEGQVRLREAHVRVMGQGEAARLAALYLAAAGVGRLSIEAERHDPWIARLRERATGEVRRERAASHALDADVCLALGSEAVHDPQGSLRVIDTGGALSLRFGAGRSAPDLPAFVGPWIADAAQRRLLSEVTGDPKRVAGTLALLRDGTVARAQRPGSMRA